MEENQLRSVLVVVEQRSYVYPNPKAFTGSLHELFYGYKDGTSLGMMGLAYRAPDQKFYLANLAYIGLVFLLGYMPLLPYSGTLFEKLETVTQYILLRHCKAIDLELPEVTSCIV